MVPLSGCGRFATAAKPAVLLVVQRPLKMLGAAFEIGKHAIASLAPPVTELPLEKKAS